MNLIFLGTGTSQGVPVIGCDCATCKSSNEKDNRLRSSVLIEVDGLNILIDPGPDLRQQFLRENIKKLDAIIITHEHKDHTGGLDDIRAFNYINKVPMDVYAEERAISALKLDYSYIFNGEKYPGIPKVSLHKINEKPFYIGDTQIIPIRVMHHKLPILGFRIKNLTYITDANYISDKEKLKVTGSKHLIINALRKEKHISHFDLKTAIEVTKSCNSENVFLTHISHSMGLHDKVCQTLPEGIQLAYDRLKINIT